MIKEFEKEHENFILNDNWIYNLRVQKFKEENPEQTFAEDHIRKAYEEVVKRTRNEVQDGNSRYNPSL